VANGDGETGTPLKRRLRALGPGFAARSPQTALSGTFISMKTLEIQVPDDVAAKIEAAAHSHGVSVEELLQSTIEEKLARDAEFENAATRVLAKNAKLYERLSR